MIQEKENFYKVKHYLNWLKAIMQMDIMSLQLEIGISFFREVSSSIYIAKNAGLPVDSVKMDSQRAGSISVIPV